MDALPYVDALFKEYLLFRGFTSTLETFNKDLAADPGCGFQADRITELIFKRLIPGLACQQLVDFLEHLNRILYSHLDSRYEPLVSAVEADLLRAFLVTATVAKRPDKVAEFFKVYGPQLLSNAASRGSTAAGLDDGSVDWRDWFVLPYLQHPEKEAHFQVYFTSEWLSLLEVSFRNFLTGVLRCLPLPAVLRFNTDRRLRLALQQQVNALQSELDRMKQQLAAATSAVDQQQQSQQSLQEAPQQRHQQPEQVQQLAEPVIQQPTLLRSLDAAVAAAGSMQPDVYRSSSSGQHKSGASVNEWQLQSRLLQRSNAAEVNEGQEMQPLRQALHLKSNSSNGLQSGGSGLFELLPLRRQTAASAPGANETAAAHSTGLKSQSHSRAASSGGISFDPEMTSATAVATVENKLDDRGSDTHDSREVHASTTTEPIAIHTSRDDLSHRTGAPAGSRGSTGSSAGVGSASQLNVLPSSPTSSAASSPPAATPLSSSPAVSLAAGILPAGSSSGMRPQHASNAITVGPGGGSSSTAAATAGAARCAVMPLALLPGPLLYEVNVHSTQAPSGTSGRLGVSCVAFSPSGGNVASACEDGMVAIWCPPGVPGNTNRLAAIACGAPVSCVAWDARADKLMLIGCTGGGGVRAWHADTRRVMHDVGAEQGFPDVVALAACSSEPTFVVAANNRALPKPLQSLSATASSSSEVAGQPLIGRLSSFNSRSFKRSAVLALPDDVGLASLAYSSSGSQLLVGTTAGTVLLYEPGSRSSPLRIWQMARATVSARINTSSSSRTAASVELVQVLWRPAPASTEAGTSSSSIAHHHSAGAGASSNSFMTLCNGVLCEWSLAGVSSKTPRVAVDVVAAAIAATEVQPPGADNCATDVNVIPLGPPVSPAEQTSEAASVNITAPSTSSRVPSIDRQTWICRFAVSPDGCKVAVVAGTQAAGVLLLYELDYVAVAESSRNVGRISGGNVQIKPPQVLLIGDMLAGGGCVAWHPTLPVLVVGCAANNSSLSVTLGVRL